MAVIIEPIADQIIPIGNITKIKLKSGKVPQGLPVVSFFRGWCLLKLSEYTTTPAAAIDKFDRGIEDAKSNLNINRKNMIIVTHP